MQTIPGLRAHSFVFVDWLLVLDFYGAVPKAPELFGNQIRLYGGESPSEVVATGFAREHRPGVSARTIIGFVISNDRKMRVFHPRSYRGKSSLATFLM